MIFDTRSSRRLMLKIRRNEGKWRPIKFSSRRNRPGSQSVGKSADETSGSVSFKEPPSLLNPARVERQAHARRRGDRQGRIQSRLRSLGRRHDHPSRRNNFIHERTRNGRRIRCTHVEDAMLMIENDKQTRARARTLFTYMKIIAKYTRVGFFSSDPLGAAFRFFFVEVGFASTCTYLLLTT